MKRFLFYCNKCGFEYSGGSEKPCSCSFCGAINECCYVEEISEDKPVDYNFPKFERSELIDTSQTQIFK